MGGEGGVRATATGVCGACCGEGVRREWRAAGGGGWGGRRADVWGWWHAFFWRG